MLHRTVATDRNDEAVAPPRNRLDAAAFRLSSVQHPTQHRDLHRQGVVLDCYAGPDRVHDVLPGDQRALMLDQHAQYI
jgi:hypothetical protein